jgi:alkylation response protein AidB-like acyl-CoA dehydrogenase
VDIDDTPEEAAFRAEAREWLEANAVPKGSAEDFSTGVWSSDYDEGTYVARCRAWQRRLYEGGWAGITWPQEYGGRGGKPIEQVIFNQEQARFGVSTGALMIAVGMVGPTLLAHGTVAQKDRYLPAMLRGDELWCQLFSEPDAGSDLASLTTRAETDSDDWVVTGQKVWTSSAHRAAWGILLARTGPTDRPPEGRPTSARDGITYFLVDMASPGIDMRPLKQMTGDSHFFEVFLDRVRIPGHNIVGGVGDGWPVARTTLTSERSSISAAGGVDARGLISLAQRADRNKDPLLRQALVRAYTDGEVLRYLRYRTQTAVSQGRRPGQEASIMKTLWARHMKHLTATALAVQGPTGQLGEIEGADRGTWQRRFLHSSSLSIAGGTDQVQANIVGERSLGLPREPQPGPRPTS